jgi:hypothetical protein
MSAASDDNSPVRVFICGGDNCPKDGKPHQWDAEVEGECPGGGYFSSTACSKCGLSRMDYDLMREP